MARNIAIMNTSRETGKTLMSICLARELAKQGKRVLLVDADPKATLTLLCCQDAILHGLSEVFINEVDVAQCLVSLSEGLDILPAGTTSAGFDATGSSGKANAYRLKKVLSEQLSKYDFLLLDSGSNTDLMTVNTMVAADEILIPHKLTTYSTQGLIQITLLFKQLKSLAKGAKLWIALIQPRSIDIELYPLFEHKLVHCFADKILAGSVGELRMTKQQYLSHPMLSDEALGTANALAYQQLTKNLLVGVTR